MVAVYKGWLGVESFAPEIGSIDVAITFCRNSDARERNAREDPMNRKHSRVHLVAAILGVVLFVPHASALAQTTFLHPRTARTFRTRPNPETLNL